MHWETTVLRRRYSAMVLSNGLANGLSKSILKTPHRQKNNKLDFHHKGTLTLMWMYVALYSILIRRCQNVPCSTILRYFSLSSLSSLLSLYIYYISIYIYIYIIYIYIYIYTIHIIPDGISGFEWDGWMNDSMTQKKRHSFVTTYWCNECNLCVCAVCTVCI